MNSKAVKKIVERETKIIKSSDALVKDNSHFDDIASFNPHGDSITLEEATVSKKSSIPLKILFTHSKSTNERFYVFKPFYAFLSGFEKVMLGICWSDSWSMLECRNFL